MSKDERRAAVPQDIKEAISTLRMLRDDLPDGLWDEARETAAWVSEFIRGETSEPNWQDVREELNEICESYAFPSLFDADSLTQSIIENY